MLANCEALEMTHEQRPKPTTTRSLRSEDPLVEAISNSCMRVVFWLGVIIATGAAAGLAVRIFIVLSGVGP